MTIGSTIGSSSILAPEAQLSIQAVNITRVSNATHDEETSEVSSIPSRFVGRFMIVLCHREDA